MYNIPKRGKLPNNPEIFQIAHKVYHIATKYTTLPQNIPHCHKIYQIATKYTKWPYNYQRLPLQHPPKFTQIGLLGLKICHLATLATVST
jgi:hypothetical protein